MQAALLCVALSILAGAAVLIVEFIHKMGQVVSPLCIACLLNVELFFEGPPVTYSHSPIERVSV